MQLPKFWFSYTMNVIADYFKGKARVVVFAVIVCAVVRCGNVGRGWSEILGRNCGNGCQVLFYC
jgi:hypothetical protein